MTGDELDDVDRVAARYRPPRPGEVIDPYEFKELQARMRYLQHTSAWQRLMDRLTGRQPPGMRPRHDGPAVR